jgi:hypothetical protein
MTVSPVFAADSAAFKQCQQIKPQGKFGPMKQKKNCFRDVARALQDELRTHETLAVDVGRLRSVESEAQYICKMSGGGTIDAKRWLSPLTTNLKRMCIPSTANGYGYEVK